MRARLPRTPGVQVVAAVADALGVRADRADGAWLSTVIHHLPDLAAAAAEIRRVLRPGAPTLIRTALPGRAAAITMTRFFPEVARTLAGYPSARQICQAFGAAGFRLAALESAPQWHDTSLAAYERRVDQMRVADTLLRSLTDAEYTAGRQRLADAVARERVEGVDPDALVARLDLLVFR